MKRIIVAGVSSGCGKTTVSCALLSALKARGLKVSAFKCGPDYIDPMFHSEVIGVPSHNLDSFFCGGETVKYLLHEYSAGSDISVIEGVMGFYDGADGKGSAYSVSQLTGTPAVIVIDCRGMSDSIGAVMKGYLEYRKLNNIKGFIFNRLPEKLAGLAERLCRETSVEYLGFMPKTGFTVESRHLGLVMADEIEDIREKLASLGKTAEKYIDIDRLISISEADYPPFAAPDTSMTGMTASPVIAVARDEAFRFIYSENMDLLKKLGCRIEYFSPIRDERVPEDADGLILCGGYPELCAERLSRNENMLSDIKSRITSGMPTIAECGGFIYLHETFGDTEGREYSGAGVIRGRAFMTEKLQRFGYVTLTSENDGLLLRRGESMPAHEFHYFDSTDCGGDMTAVKADGLSSKCVQSAEILYAGFPHLYFYSCIPAAKRFAEACGKYHLNSAAGC